MVNTIARKKIIGFSYWGCTILLSLGMLAGGIAQVTLARANVEGMKHLGYPLYLLPLLGVWKITGVITLLVPGLQLVKEWAYAGFFFAMSGAVISHLTSGDSVDKWIVPFIFLLLTCASWYLRPDNRKILHSETSN